MESENFFWVLLLAVILPGGIHAQVNYQTDSIKTMQISTNRLNVEDQSTFKGLVRVEASLSVEGEFSLGEGTVFNGDAIFQDDIRIYQDLNVAGQAIFDSEVFLPNLSPAETGKDWRYKVTTIDPNGRITATPLLEIKSPITIEEAVANAIELAQEVGLTIIGTVDEIVAEILTGGNPGVFNPCDFFTEEMKMATWTTKDNRIFTNACSTNPLVGIGVVPETRLDVVGNSSILGNLRIGQFNRGQVDVNMDSSKYAIETFGSNVMLRAHNNSSSNHDQARIFFADENHFIGLERPHTTGSSFGLRLKTFNNEGLFLKEGGGVAIGHANPLAQLHVQTNNAVSFLVTQLEGNTSQEVFKIKKDRVFARDLTVQVGTFPDYVFEKGYPLLPIEELNSFIKQHGRLPNMPKGEDVISNGMDVDETIITIVEKLEELSLYIIQLKEENDRLKSKMEELSKN